MVLLIRLVAACAAAAVVCGCDGVFFYPRAPYVTTPDRVGLAYSEERVPVDGGSLVTWHLIPGRRDPAAPVVLHLHGNGGNVSYHLPAVAWLPAEGIPVVTVDYRGYGSATGTPTLAGTVDDVSRVVSLLRSDNRYRYRKLLVFGQSLGGAFALSLLDHVRPPPCAVVTEGAVSDFRVMADDVTSRSFLRYAGALLRLLVPSSPRPIESVGRGGTIPIVVIHDPRDPVVPYHHALALVADPGGSKELWRVDGAGHTGAMASQEVRGRFLAVANRCRAGGPS